MCWFPVGLRRADGHMWTNHDIKSRCFGLPWKHDSQQPELQIVMSSILAGKLRDFSMHCYCWRFFPGGDALSCPAHHSTAHDMISFGEILFLLGLLWRAFIARATYPCLALGAHIHFVPRTIVSRIVGLVLSTDHVNVGKTQVDLM